MQIKLFYQHNFVRIITISYVYRTYISRILSLFPFIFSALMPLTCPPSPLEPHWNLIGT